MKNKETRTTAHLQDKGAPGPNKQDLATLAFIRDSWNTEQCAQEVTTLPPDWKKIAGRIKKFDQYKCAICGAPESISNRLQVHHRDSNQKDNSVENLITVCRSCHDKFPVPPFAERFYCQVMFHDIDKPICLRLGSKGGKRQASNCEFFDFKHGCILEIFGIKELKGRKE